MREQRTERAATGATACAGTANAAVGKQALVEASSGMSGPGGLSNGRAPVVQAKASVTSTDESPRPSHNLSEIGKTAIDELDGGKSMKVLLATVLAAAKVLRELLKDYSEAQIAEIEAALARAEEMMGETIGRILPPP